MDDAAAILLVHEMHGVDEHMRALREELHGRSGLEVVLPDLLPGPAAATDPYEHFVRSLGWAGMAREVHAHARSLRAGGRRVLAVGFSVGATAVWLAAGTGALDRAACVYGSRIRDHLDRGPACPTLAVFAAGEASFEVGPVAAAAARLPDVRVEVQRGTHGFCNPGEPVFDAALRERVLTDVLDHLLARPSRTAG